MTDFWEQVAIYQDQLPVDISIRPADDIDIVTRDIEVETPYIMASWGSVRLTLWPTSAYGTGRIFHLPSDNTILIARLLEQLS